MMIIHICLFLKAFTPQIIEYLIVNFPEGHEFHVIGHDIVGIKRSPNVYIHEFSIGQRTRTGYFRKINSIVGLCAIIVQLFKHNHIIFHGLFYPPLFFILLSLFTKHKKRYWNWIVFGGDLYDKKEVITESLFSFKRYYGYLKYLAVKDIGFITTLTKGDYYLAKQYYKVTGVNHVISYSNMEDIVSACRFVNLGSFKSTEKVRILLGNSASTENCHIEALNMLKKFYNCKICVYVPLSYGDQIYAEKVIEYGYKILGDRFTPVRNYMPYEKYIKFLASMDIVLLNNNRQQALGNIFLCLLLGKKIYINPATTMWNHFRDAVDVTLYSIETLPNLSFDQFVRYESDIKSANMKKIRLYLGDKNARIKAWHDLFMDMQKVKLDRGTFN